ncbi:hypothetical protein B5C26_00800 [Photorhabdus luminescens]|uniref:hypothetical protein n=1 Tax=Photorhabdus luminescens TaxID=29488 RepID=UPI000B4DD05C|nr:hypothetical protein [Photorhabdus luminescens]OWO86989.1 hypothetical protein B5C26_00800 [Photorhabdus luminescens]
MNIDLRASEASITPASQFSVDVTIKITSIADILNAIDDNDAVLEEIGVGDVISWLDTIGYSVREKED